MPTDVFREAPENRRIRKVQSMLSEFVFYPAAAIGCRLSLPGGSNRVQAQPARRQQPGAGSACRPCPILFDMCAEVWYTVFGFFARTETDRQKGTIHAC